MNATCDGANTWKAGTSLEPNLEPKKPDLLAGGTAIADRLLGICPALSGRRFDKKGMPRSMPASGEYRFGSSIVVAAAIRTPDAVGQLRSL